MILFFDTETTGLPRNWNAPITQINTWPRMVQLAWLQYDTQGNLIAEGNRIIKPEGFKIPNKAAAVHGITTRYALKNGYDLTSVLADFSELISGSSTLIAHNMNFDEKIVGAEYIRLGIKSSLFDTNRICTMTTTTDLCRIPGNYGYKWPTLSELHQFLFGSDFKDAHDASVDVKICAKCFFELVKRGFHKLS